MEQDEVLTGGLSRRGVVIRQGGVIHRSRSAGSDAVEALLRHLEVSRFDGGPRFLGHDNQGMQVLAYVPGQTFADQQPPWLTDDDENARVLGRIAEVLSRLHIAVEGFVPPGNAPPLRSLPLPAPCGTTATCTTATTRSALAI